MTLKPKTNHGKQRNKLNVGRCIDYLPYFSSYFFTALKPSLWHILKQKTEWKKSKDFSS
jgi:hypothetical protein